MPTPFSVDEASARALAETRAALDAGHVEAAYHFLMAALHCAADAHNGVRLAEIATLAHEQQRTVDALSPPHRLGTQSAHGPHGIFAMAATTAKVAARQVESREWLERHRPHPPAPEAQGPETPIAHLFSCHLKAAPYHGAIATTAGSVCQEGDHRVRRRTPCRTGPSFACSSPTRTAMLLTR